MKNILVRRMMMAIIIVLALNACTGAPSQASSPTETSVPTSLATPTIAPTSTPAPSLLGDYELLSPEAMRFDLEELFHQIETTHPDPYTKRSKAEMDLERRRIDEELGQPMTMLDFYRKVAPLVNSLGDANTNVSLPYDIRSTAMESELYFPFDLQREGEHIHIRSSYSENRGIRAGTELLAVNGIPGAALYEEAERYFPGRAYIISPTFLYLFGSSEEYHLKVILPGQTAPVTLKIKGRTTEEITTQAFMNRTANTQEWEPVMYRALPDEKIGVLTVHSFAGNESLLEPAFTEIREDQVEHLIIDIRSGGSETFTDIHTLMSHLTGEPYMMCSQSVEAPSGGYGSGDARETRCMPLEPFEIAERFQGQLYLLVGPDTYLAGITFANILQDHDLATLIGEETISPASHCTKASRGVPLSRTGLSYRISTKCFVRPSGILDERGVIPDMIVETTIADQIAGNDPVLDYTLEMIRNGRWAP